MQGGVRLGHDAASLEVVHSADADVEVPEGVILKVGKRRFCCLRLR